MLPTTSSSSPSSLAQMGMGVPQNLWQCHHVRHGRQQAAGGAQVIASHSGHEATWELSSATQHHTRLLLHTQSPCTPSPHNSITPHSTPSPAHLLLDTAQSCAPSSQLWNLFSFTYEGTQYVWALLARSRSLMDSTRTNQLGTALGGRPGRMG